MTLLPHVPWLVIILAVVLLGDAVLSLRPPTFIQRCLDGVGFPRQWWWVLVVVKMTAAIGLIVGLWVPGVAAAANVGVLLYFSCAAAAHIRARFTGKEFWVNCMGMLLLALTVLVVGLV